MSGPQRIAILSSTVLVAMLAACASSPDAGPAAGGSTTVEGSIASIDTSPWAYDGNAVVAIDTASRGRVAVQLPARWNLCRAAAVDVAALAVGMRVRVTGAEEEGTLVVCQDPAHGVVPLR